MNSLLDQLHDIDGVDPISWWPLAIGWWILIALGIALLCALMVFIGYRIAFMRSWKNDTLQKLAYLENNLSDATARDTVIALSEYLRRIALRRFTRKECAGLTGEAWLEWLSKNDTRQFDWVNKGSLLINVPYSPNDAGAPSGQIKELIQAVKEWVR